MVQKICLIVTLPTTHHLAFLWAFIVWYNFLMEKLFAACRPPEWLLPIDDIIATNNGCMCDVHCIGCSIMLLLARMVHGFGRLLHLLETTPDDLAACFVLCNGRANLKFLKHKLIYFYIN